MAAAGRYLGYDMVRQMEKLQEKNVASIDVPEAVMVAPTFAIFDNVTRLLTLAAPVYPREGVTAAQAWEGAQAAIASGSGLADRCRSQHRVALRNCRHPRPISPRPGSWRSGAGKGVTHSPGRFPGVRASVFSVPFALPPFSLYRALRGSIRAVLLPRLRRLGRGRLAARKSWSGCATAYVTIRPLRAPAGAGHAREDQNWSRNCSMIRRKAEH